MMISTTSSSWASSAGQFLEAVAAASF
jgi:hypothetical protein